MARSTIPINKSFNAMAQVVCVSSDGYRSSRGLSTILDIKARTKKNAETIAKKTWRIRGELPVKRGKYKARCTIHPSVEEAY